MKTLSIITLCTTLFATTACAAYNGPSAGQHQKATVKEALAAKDDQEMSLEGYVINHIKKDKYTFQDSTGTMVIEIDHEDLYNININEKTLVRIHGEVDKDFNSLDFDVDSIRIVK